MKVTIECAFCGKKRVARARRRPGRALPMISLPDGWALEVQPPVESQIVSQVYALVCSTCASVREGKVT